MKSADQAQEDEQQIPGTASSPLLCGRLRARCSGPPGDRFSAGVTPLRIRKRHESDHVTSTTAWAGRF
jgi:hypothetical protein